MTRVTTHRARIAVLGGFAPSLISFRGHLLAAMAARGHEIVCGAAGFTGDAVAELSRLGVVRCRELPMRRAGMNPAGDGRSFMALCAWLREERPDVLFAYTAKPVIYGGLAARTVGVPDYYPLITGLGYAFGAQPGLRRRMVASLVRRLYGSSLRAATATLFQNPDDEREFRQRRILRARDRTVITNGSGVDLDHYAPAPPPQPSGGPCFLFIGRLLREKGVRELVGAARRVHRVRADVRIQILGDVDDNPTSLSHRDVEALQREGSVEILGEREDVRPYIAAASGLVLPSYREGTPRVVLEAMSMGRPIITTDVPGCRETVVHGENGLLVPARDEDALAGAILQLADSPARCAAMGAQSRAFAEERYDVHKVNATILGALGLSDVTAPTAAVPSHATTGAA